MADPPAFPERFSMADYFLYDRTREGRGGRVAVRTRERAWTYEEVARASDRVGNVLRELGVEPEDRVLLALPDGIEFVAGVFGALRIGGVVCMVNSLLPAEDLAYYVTYSRCRALVCDVDVAAKLRPFLDGFSLLRGALVVGDVVPEHGKLHSYRLRVRDVSDRCEAFPSHRDDPAYWLFTSGSTGKPKAAIHLQHDFPWNCERYAKRVLGYRESDVTLSVPKLYFGYGTGTNLFFPFSVGATTCLFPEKATPEVLFEAVERFRPTILTSVPTSINALVSHIEAPRRDLSSLRFTVSAGEALPPELLARWRSAFGSDVLDGIGSAETFHIYITNAPGDVTPGCLGRLVPGYEAKITDGVGREVGAGEIGTLWVRGDSVAVGYWQAREKSKETFFGDWVKSADLFRRDAEGRFWYAGRSDDLLKVGGLFVSPLEVEDCLLRHPAVAECCVVGYREADLEKPIAFVIPRPGVETGAALGLDVARFVKERLAAYKYPRRVRFLAELPRNDRGKVERLRLREELAAHGLVGSHDTDLSTRSRTQVAARA